MAEQAVLNNICERTLAAAGYELVQVELVRGAPGWVLRVLIDNPHTGAVTLDDCARASRDLSAALDVADPIDQHYTLEVSSPGLERPLTQERDFERFAGRRAHLRLREPLEGRRNFSGTLRGFRGGLISIECENRLYELPLSAVAKAHLEVEPALGRG
ncbi:MAG TPA: ribosome maturation factor RimP [Polyangia bacterium]|nr:ribosome maturation factor RimP [Polyangia bacterium]